MFSQTIKGKSQYPILVFDNSAKNLIILQVYGCCRIYQGCSDKD